jgi:hypothetical protein
MSTKLSDIGFRIFTTNDFLFGLFSQLPLLLWNGVVTREIPLATFRCLCSFEVFPRFNEDILDSDPKMPGIAWNEQQDCSGFASTSPAREACVVATKELAAMDAQLVETTIKIYLTEIRSRLDKAAGIGRAADACAGAGFHEKGLEVALDMEQLLYEATTLLNAASLINRISQQSWMVTF